ncbi:MAG: replication-relaxation family protein [Mycobacteriales bacterium]
MSPWAHIGRDEDLLRLVWSFGALLPEQLRALLGCTRTALMRRLGPLVSTQALQRLPYHGRTYLYAIGPRIGDAAADLVGGWLPSPALYTHTLLGVDLVIAFRARQVPGITAWAGEAELRTWVGRGEAIPDASLSWQLAGRSGQFLVETDRGTEPEKIWRAKLARYRRLWDDESVLVSAPTRSRAARIASLAFDMRVALFAGVHEELVGPADPLVFDALAHRRWRLGEALAPRAEAPKATPLEASARLGPPAASARLGPPAASPSLGPPAASARLGPPAASARPFGHNLPNA